MDGPSTPAWIIFLTGLLSVAIPVSPCPTAANTTCCACASTPGCSWYSPPEAPAYCARSPYLHGDNSLPAWSEGGSGVTPSYPWSIVVRRDEPFTQGDRPRQLRPQEVVLTLAVGVRHQLPVRLSARSARTNLFVRGPAWAVNGHVEFGLRQASAHSCSRGLTERRAASAAGAWRDRRGPRRGSRRVAGGRGTRTAAATSRRRRDARDVRRRVLARRQPGRYPRRRVYSCRGAGPGLVHDLWLEVDVKRCLDRQATLVLLARSAGVRSRVARFKVRSLCHCPACSSGSGTTNQPGANGDQGSNESGQRSQTPPCGNSNNNDNNDDDNNNNNNNKNNQNNNANIRCSGENVTQALSPQAMLCLRRGANDGCVPALSFPSGVSSTAACSGRGLCVCGACACGPRHELYPAQRYTGQHCQCDDYGCSRSAGALCGGPSRGRCVCGRCECQPGWAGAACEQSESVENCVGPTGGAGAVCGGRGMCLGGACDCDSPYTGQFCECDGQGC